MRYVLGIFGFIILAIVAVVLISTATRDRSPEQVGKAQVDVSEFADKSATFTMTNLGEIVGQDQFRSIRISITPTERRFQVLAGYDNAVQSEQVFSNVQSAYSAFAEALDNAGYSRQRDSVVTDVTGACPLGERFVYQINESGNEVLNLWSSTCRGQGNFGGNRTLVQSLFKNQIPNYNDLVKDVDL